MKVYARKCKIKKIDNPTVDVFLNQYHHQKTCRGQKHCYGLFYENQLIGLMTFGQPRYNYNVQYELLRLCYHPNYNIVGGSLKLFNAFLREKEPNSIVSYCDTQYFTGEVYPKMGFKLIHKGEESVIWKKGESFITLTQLLKYGADNLIGTNEGKGSSNEEVLEQNGWVKERRAPQDTYLWDSKCEGTIYLVTNLLNNKKYIGQTKRDLEIRWKEHCTDSENTGLLDPDIQKYGKENFKVEVLEKVYSHYEMNKRERYWIKKLDTINNGYNITTGGQKYFGYSPTEETKEKIRETLKGSFFWITNGKEDKHWNFGNPIPKGYYKGRTNSFKPVGREITKEEREKKKNWYQNLSAQEKEQFKKSSQPSITKEQKSQKAKSWWSTATEEQKSEIKRRRKEALIKKGIWKQ